DPSFGICFFSDPVREEATAALMEVAERLVEKEKIDVLLIGDSQMPMALTMTSLNGVPVVDAATELAKGLIRASCPERLKESL
ncbi:MAG: aspartate racemase, partial [Desulfovibrionaceae bacterium]|nr:aspartate racemase [Desulfovibrionaceae bacterium]